MADGGQIVLGEFIGGQLKLIKNQVFSQTEN